MRLVDADALKAKSFGKRGGLIHTSDIDDAPTVDAVLVVRCKGCKYWDAFPSSTLAPDHHECKRIRIHTTAEWFCAAGERKDGECEYFGVVAWMEKPEPWKGGE